MEPTPDDSEMDKRTDAGSEEHSVPAWRELLALARPSHWMKNVIVLFPVLFALRFDSGWAWLAAGVAAASFCLASSAGYVFNDLWDRREDLYHPVKKDRPVAAGRVEPTDAAIYGGLLAASAFAVSAAVNLYVVGAVAGYLLLQVAYTLALKHLMIIDVIVIAAGFVVRAAAGALALHVAVSPWLVVCTFTICLFMGFCKRRMEVAAMEESGEAAKHRRSLAGYSPELLTHLITLSAAVAIVSYLLYAASARTVQHFGTNYLVYTLPLVIYAVSRFAMVSMQDRYHDPTELILKDRPFQAGVVLWVLSVVLIILAGPSIGQWLAKHC